MRNLPRNLTIVAWLFIIGGVFAGLEMFVAFLSGRISINLGILSFFIGRGLLDLNPRSLKWATVLNLLGLIMLPFAAILFLFTPGHLKILGMKVGQAPYGLGLVFCIGAFALTYWEYKVLTSEDTQQLFVDRYAVDPYLRY
jgi:hypothetical protein